MTMVEKVARALFDKSAAAGSLRGKIDWSSTSEIEKYMEEYYALARVAIEAMKEPTMAMQLTGAALRDEEEPAHGTDEIWRAMLAAALAEEPSSR